MVRLCGLHRALLPKAHGPLRCWWPLQARTGTRGAGVSRVRATGPHEIGWVEILASLARPALDIRVVMKSTSLKVLTELPRGRKAVMSRVAVCLGRGRWRRAESAGQCHPLAGAWGSLFGGKFSQRGTLAGARLRELVAWRGVCVLNGCTCARVCAWGGVSAPEPVGYAGGRRRPERCRRLFVTPGDLRRDRER